MQPTADLRTRYLDLLEASLKNAIYGESRIETFLRAAAQRLRHPYLTRHGAFRWPARAHTMIPVARLRTLRLLVERTLKEDIAGDYIETGVWRGGGCIYMRGILAAYDVTDRRVFCADSFAGLPKPNKKLFPADRASGLFRFPELAVSDHEVRRNFAAYGLLDNQVVFVKGLFGDTLPRLAGESFALIRLDGDMYESTMAALVNLYPRVSPRGFAIIDDYPLGGCRAAVHDYLSANGVTATLNDGGGGSIWWQKPDHPPAAADLGGRPNATCSSS